MFEQLSDRLNLTIKRMRGQARITEDNIADAMREIRIALLEADVSLPVVRSFVDSVKAKAIGEEVKKSLTPGQVVVKIVNDELAALMGEKAEPLSYATQPPAVFLMAGLQGAGKTTTTAKLAKLITERDKKKVLLTSVDIYRPAAIEQLKRLSEQIGVDCYQADDISDPVAMAEKAKAYAKAHFYDVLIVDTAGRLHVDENLMSEVTNIHSRISPIETLFVVDGMAGQDAANSAKAFNEALPLTGVILTKMDGDARGGAALSIRHITEKPIKYLGIGEAIDAIEVFHPERIASRILGMGDVVSLVEDVSRSIDQKESEKLVRKLKTGKAFDLEDFKSQLLQMEKMGGLGSLLGKMPGMSGQNLDKIEQQGSSEFKRMLSVINSMTMMERKKPELIKGSRKRRIANGSGTQVQDVNRLLKQFTQMQKMMKKMKGKKGMRSMMGALGGMGGMPGGGMPPRGGRPF